MFALYWQFPEGVPFPPNGMMPAAGIFPPGMAAPRPMSMTHPANQNHHGSLPDLSNLGFNNHSPNNNPHGKWLSCNPPDIPGMVLVQDKKGRPCKQGCLPIFKFLGMGRRSKAYLISPTNALTFLKNAKSKVKNQNFRTVSWKSCQISATRIKNSNW